MGKSIHVSKGHSAQHGRQALFLVGAGGCKMESVRVSIYLASTFFKISTC